MMKKLLFLILLSIIGVQIHAADEPVALSVLPVSRSIPVVWDLGTVEIPFSPSYTFHGVDENGNKVDGELSALSLKRDGMRASKQFYATIGITSKDTVNVSISSTGYGSMKRDDGNELHWTLKMKDGDSWTTIIDKNSYDDAKVFHNHIPSEHGISSSEDILFELETESILMLEEGTYRTAITIKTEGME